MNQLFAVKPLHQLTGDADHGPNRLRRTLRAPQLLALSIGAIIGAGIFSTVGSAAAGNVAVAISWSELTNIGTLFAFVLVAIGILVLRRTNPDAPRPFRTPLVPWVPLLAIASCGYLMLQLPRVTWERFVIWLVIGIGVYFAYGYRHSRLRHESRLND